MTSIVEKCKDVVVGAETEFIANCVGAEIPEGHGNECVMLTEAFAQAFPADFVRAVGAFLHDCVEVA